MDKKFYNEDTKEMSIPEDEPQLFEDGLGCLIFERLKLYSNKIIQIDSTNNEKDYGASLLQRSVRTALEMKARGVKENDTISVCSHNHINAIVPIVAATFLGAIPASLDPSFSEDDLTDLINLAQPKIIFATHEPYKKIDLIKKNLNCNTDIVVFSNGIERNAFGSFLQKNENEDVFVPTKRSLDDLAVIFFSSGTTGLPKGISTTMRSVLKNCNNPGCETLLIYSSLYWIGSYYCSMKSIINGKTKVLCSEFDPTTAWNLYAKFKVESMIINPFKVSFLINSKVKPELPNLKYVFVTGSAFCKEHLLKLRDLLPNSVVVNAYGQSEVYFTFNPKISLGMNKYESVGVPIPGKTYKVVDLETGEALGFNKPGELRIKSKYISGYYKVDKKDCFDSNGFFKTGDVVYYDEDFCFYVVDRVKEMFKYRGWHVVPAKIEGIIRKHPGILDAVVVGIPDLVDENLALAIVIPKLNYELAPKEIEEFANRLLDDIHQIRAGVKIVLEFPETPSGKILRRKLKDMFLANEL